jgi:hypothetical protein
LCEGSVKYIHQNCLKTWITKQNIYIDEANCELCTTKYNVEFETFKECKKDKFYSLLMKIFMFNLVIVCILITLCFIIYQLVPMIFKWDEKKKLNLYGYLIYGSVGIFIISFLSYIYTSRNYCFVQSVRNWNILNINNNLHDSKKTYLL